MRINPLLKMVPDKCTRPWVALVKHLNDRLFLGTIEPLKNVN